MSEKNEQSPALLNPKNTQGHNKGHNKGKKPHHHKKPGFSKPPQNNAVGDALSKVGIHRNHHHNKPGTQTNEAIAKNRFAGDTHYLKGDPSKYEGDGKDHIRIHLTAKTWLGRQLSIYIGRSFNHPEFGTFKSVMGAILYIRSHVPSNTHRIEEGMDKKLENFRNDRDLLIYVENFHALVGDIIWQSIKNRKLEAEIVKSTLPFDDYIVHRDGRHEREVYTTWLIPMMEEIRDALRENREPNFRYWMDRQVETREDLYAGVVARIEKHFANEKPAERVSRGSFGIKPGDVKSGGAKPAETVFVGSQHPAGSIGKSVIIAAGDADPIDPEAIRRDQINFARGLKDHDAPDLDGVALVQDSGPEVSSDNITADAINHANEVLDEIAVKLEGEEAPDGSPTATLVENVVQPESPAQAVDAADGQDAGNGKASDLGNGDEKSADALAEATADTAADQEAPTQPLAAAAEPSEDGTIFAV